MSHKRSCGHLRLASGAFGVAGLALHHGHTEVKQCCWAFNRHSHWLASVLIEVSMPLLWMTLFFVGVHAYGIVSLMER